MNTTFFKCARLLQKESISSGICKKNIINTCTSCLRRFHTMGKLQISIKDARVNPLSFLQPHIANHILPKDEITFTPSKSEMIAADKIFVSTPHHSIQFLTSVMTHNKLPKDNRPEVAFLGRSNVGKSSLIKAMFRDSPDVMIRVSKKPGRTRMLNFFQVGKCFSLVDMPGYGYNMPKNFVENVEMYLNTRRNLAVTFMLVDAEIGLTPRDKEYLQKVQNFGIRFCIVLTKIDKVGRHVLLKNLMNVIEYRQKYADCCLAQPFLVSAESGAGISLVKTFIAYVTGSVKIEGL